MTTQLPSKERLAQLADENTICKVSWDERIAMARALLAACEQEPVAFVKSGYALCYYRPPQEYGLKIGDKLFRHPAPSIPAAVPEERTFLFYCEKYPEMPMGDAIIRAVEWNACRAAMLQAEPAGRDYRAIVERIAEIMHGSVTDVDLLTVTVLSMKQKTGPVGRQQLHDLVDVVWNEATESTAVPSTEWADQLIDKVLTIPPEPVSNRYKLPAGYALVPVDMTPGQMRAVQIKSELGSYAAANLSGAYALFREFWDLSLAAAPSFKYKP